MAAKKAGAGLLFILTAAMGIGPLMSYGLSSTSSLIIEDFGISESQFGLLATVCFFSAALSSAWLGRLSDKISGQAQLFIMFGGVAIALLITAGAPNYLWLLAAVALSGPAQAISNPTTNRLIIHHVEPAKRPGWIGLKQSGVQVSQLFSGLYFPAAALVIGWQGAAAGAAVIAVGLLLYAWNRIPADPLPDAGLKPTAAAATPPAAGAPVSRRVPSAVWLLAAFALLNGIGAQATNVYLPLFTIREVGFTLVMGGVASAVAGVVGVASRVQWGRQVSRGMPAATALLYLAVGAVSGAVLLLTAGLTGSPLVLWAGIVLHGATVLGVSVVVMSAVMRLVPAARVGTASGVVALGMYLGFSIGPLAMGLLLQISGSFFAGWLMVGGSYLLCVLLALVLRRRAAS